MMKTRLPLQKAGSIAIATVALEWTACASGTPAGQRPVADGGAGTGTDAGRNVGEQPDGAPADGAGRDASPVDGGSRSFEGGTDTGPGSVRADGGAPPIRDAGSAEDAQSPPGEACDRVEAVIRDFRGHDRGGHPDFENINEDEPDYMLTSGSPEWPHSAEPYLATELGDDDKPRYVASGPSPGDSIRSPESFHDWYHDTERNMRFEVTLEDMDPADERFTFADSEFFPIDGRGYGDNHSPASDPGTAHNYHFTTEIVAEFEYRGGERFTFSGDDDVWVFVNGKLALDLGGQHEREEATIDFDALSDYLGIEIGKTYTLRLFHAERHTSRSAFSFTTSIDCLEVVL